MSIENKFKRSLKQDKVQYGIWNGLPHSYAAEICAGAGFDFVVVDAEHGPFEISDIIVQMQAMGRYPDSSTVVRIANDDPILMKRLMDAGVQSFIIPMIESAEQAETMYKALRYPPTGTRGVGTALARAAQWNRVNKYFELSDDEMCLICQIESVKGWDGLCASPRPCPNKALNLSVECFACAGIFLDTIHERGSESEMRGRPQWQS